MAETLDPVTPRTAMSWAEFLAAGEERQCRDLEDGEVEFLSPAGHQHGRVIPNRVAGLRAHRKARREWIDSKWRAAEVKCPDRASRYFEGPGPLRERRRERLSA